MNTGIEVGAGKTELCLPVWNWLKEQLYVTLRYMNMIVSFYLIIPVIVMIKRGISGKLYIRLAVIMMFYGVVVSISCFLSWILQLLHGLDILWLGGIRAWGGKIWSTYQKIIGGWYGPHWGAAYIMIVAHCRLFAYRSGRIIVPENFSGTVVVAVLLQFLGISVMPIKGRN